MGRVCSGWKPCLHTNLFFISGWRNPKGRPCTEVFSYQLLTSRRMGIRKGFPPKTSTPVYHSLIQGLCFPFFHPITSHVKCTPFLVQRERNSGSRSSAKLITLSSTIQLTGLRLPALTSFVPWVPYSTPTQRITWLSSKFSISIPGLSWALSVLLWSWKARPLCQAMGPPLGFTLLQLPLSLWSPGWTTCPGLCSQISPERLLGNRATAEPPWTATSSQHMHPSFRPINCPSINYPFQIPDFLSFFPQE